MNQVMGDNLHKHYKRGKHPQAMKRGGGEGVLQAPRGLGRYNMFEMEGDRILLMMTCCSMQE